MEEQKYILAMYDIRGKQDFIFRKGKIREVIGASWLIRDLFVDYLENGSKDIKIYKYKPEDPDSSFTWENFKKHLGCGYAGEVIYDGGGNYFVMYRDMDTYVAINKRLTARLMEEVGTIKVLCSCVEVSAEKNNYRDDERQLRLLNRRDEANESVNMAVCTLPFTQVDKNTSYPLVGYDMDRNVKSGRNKLSKESLAKINKYVAQKNKLDQGEIVLDKLVEEKGKNSLLAIIHIDGNNMGAKVQAALKKEDGTELLTYEDCIERLRRFSNEIQKDFIDDRKKEVYAALNNNRFVVSAGDDFTIICKAQDAKKAVTTYFDGLNRTNKNNTSCAGIAIFHSHAPFAEAYRIAEECCDNAKKVMKDNGITDASIFDFEYLQSGIGISLEKIREDVGGITSKPWIYGFNEKDFSKLKDKNYVKYGEEKDGFINAQMIIGQLKELGRSNVKGLAGAALESSNAFRFELERIVAHTGKGKNILSEYKNCLNDQMKERRFRGLVYDCVIFYDLWFAKREEKAEDLEDGKV